VVVLVDLAELAEHWTLLEDERELVAGKQGPTRLGFALLLKFYTRAGRFPRGRADLDGDAVAFVARQVGVPASDLGFYEWSGRTFKYHRAQVRRHLGFREYRANAVIFFGKGGDIATNRRDEQELSVLCLRILQAALVYVNTLMVQDVLADEMRAERLTAEDKRV